MMTKIYKFFLSILLIVGFGVSAIGPSYAGYIDQKETTNSNTSLETSVLNWSTFSTSQREGKEGQPLNCDEDWIKSKVKQSFDELSGWYQTAKPGEVSDVKGCLMEKKVDQYARWFIFLGIVVLVGFLIYLGVTVAVKSEGGDSMGMPGGGGGSGGGVFEKIKAPLIGLGILVVVLLGGLNIVVDGFKFFFDVFLR